MDVQQRINELCNKLNAARNAYYNENKEIMSNKEFDDLMDELEKLEKAENYHPDNSPIGKVGFAITKQQGRREVIHEKRARSLDKTKDPKEVISKLTLSRQDAMRSVFTGGNETLCMWKLDGCTLVLTYVNNELVLAATRGDGEKGTDVTNNTKYIKGVPQHIKGADNHKVIVRGECLISYADFDKINSNLPEGTEPYANARNLASASVTMLDPEEMKDRCVVFKAFDLEWADGYPSDFQCPYNMVHQFVWLKENGFGVVDYEVTTVPNIEQSIRRFTDKVASYEYPVDGLVFALLDRTLSKDLPGTEHHPDPKYGYAFKWADEEVETTLRDIEWSPSRTGRLNPVAIFDTVQIAGTSVSRASLHNLTYIKNKLLNKGDKITVIKSNMIIPMVVKNLSAEKANKESNDIRLANILNAVSSLKCPTCGEQVIIRDEGVAEFCHCPNPECPEKLIGKLSHFCSRDGLDIDGWSEQTIKKLVDLKIIKEYRDIFRLHEHAGLAFVPGFGKKSWENLCKSAETASHTTFVKFLSALDITDVGKGTAKILKKYIDENYKKLHQEYNMDDTYFPMLTLIAMAFHNFDFTKIDGIGDIMASNISNWIKSNYDPNELSECQRLNGYITWDDKEPVADDFMNLPSSNIAGKSFCITGKLIYHANRQELVDKIEANGGKWVDSVSSKTDYLINNDVASTSGKNAKAKQLNIPIISEEDFMSMIS